MKSTEASFDVKDPRKGFFPPPTSLKSICQSFHFFSVLPVSFLTTFSVLSHFVLLFPSFFFFDFGPPSPCRTSLSRILMSVCVSVCLRLSGWSVVQQPPLLPPVLVLRVFFGEGRGGRHRGMGE